MYVHTDGGLCVNARNTTNTSPAVLGWSNAGVGLHGFSGGINPTDGPLNTGVYGAAGRGTRPVDGVDQRPRRPSRSCPTPPCASSASHPFRAKGDLFVDSKTRLWFCKGGTTWKQLA